MEENKQTDADQMAAVQAKCDEYLNGWKRARADFVNYQKEEEKRFEYVIKFANEELIKDIISVMDSLVFAAHNHSERSEESHTMSGLEAIQAQLEDIAKRNGVEKIAVAVGDAFNPAYHEAIAETEASSDIASGHIAEITETGYTLHGKVVRPARVKVTK